MTACVIYKAEKLEHYISIYKKLDEPPCQATNYSYYCTEKRYIMEDYQNKSVIDQPRNIISRYLYFHRPFNGFFNLISV